MTAANSAALASIWLTDYKPTVSYVKRVLRDPALAEDIAMQAFVKLGERMEQRLVLQPRELLRQITHGLVTDTVRLKDRRPLPSSFDEEASEQDSFGAGGYLATDNTFPVEFDAAVRDMPAELRDVYILTELRGVSKEEAADLLGISRRTAYRRAAEATTSIRKELAA